MLPFYNDVMISAFSLDIAVYTCEHISMHAPVRTRTMSFGPADVLGWEKSLVGVAHLLDIAEVIISETHIIICYLLPRALCRIQIIASHTCSGGHMDVNC